MRWIESDSIQFNSGDFALSKKLVLGSHDVLSEAGSETSGDQPLKNNWTCKSIEE